MTNQTNPDQQPPAPADPGRYFAGLPAELQEQLVRIARCAAGMSRQEKDLARLALTGSGRVLADTSDGDEDSFIATVELLSAVANIVRIADDHAEHNPTEERFR